MVLATVLGAGVPVAEVSDSWMRRDGGQVRSDGDRDGDGTSQKSSLVT